MTRSGMYKLVGAGATQAERLATAIEAVNRDEFIGTSAEKPAPLWIDGLTHIVPVVITLDDVSGLVGDVTSLVAAGVFPSAVRPPLVLTLTDLRIVADLLTSPVDLIHHWEFRRRVGDWNVICSDEIDLLLYDLQFGCEWLSHLQPRHVALVFNSISYRLDAHYLVNEIPQRNAEHAAPLPVREIDPTLRRRLRRLDRDRHYGFITSGLNEMAKAYRDSHPSLHMSLMSLIDETTSTSSPDQ